MKTFRNLFVHKTWVKCLSMEKWNRRWFWLAFLTKCISTGKYVWVFNLHCVHKKKILLICMCLNHGMCSPYFPSVFY